MCWDGQAHGADGSNGTAARMAGITNAPHTEPITLWNIPLCFVNMCYCGWLNKEPKWPVVRQNLGDRENAGEKKGSIRRVAKRRRGSRTCMNLPY